MPTDTYRLQAFTLGVLATLAVITLYHVLTTQVLMEGEFVKLQRVMLRSMRALEDGVRAEVNDALTDDDEKLQRDFINAK